MKNAVMRFYNMSFFLKLNCWNIRAYGAIERDHWVIGHWLHWLSYVSLWRIAFLTTRAYPTGQLLLKIWRRTKRLRCISSLRFAPMLTLNFPDGQRKTALNRHLHTLSLCRKQMRGAVMKSLTFLTQKFRQFGGSYIQCQFCRRQCWEPGFEFCNGDKVGMCHACKRL